MIFLRALVPHLFEISKYLRESFLSGVSSTLKFNNTPVTEADLEVDSRTRKFLQQEFPSMGIISEEDEDYQLNAQYQWVFDPIDGTIPFSAGTPTFCFAIALLCDGIPIVGAIVDPMSQRWLYAEKDKGTYLFTPHKKMKVSIPEPSNNYIALNSAHSVHYSIPKVQEAILAQKGFFIYNWSVVYSSLLVALGFYRGIIWSGSSPWDAAAASIIITEAGGKATDVFGKQQKYNSPIQGLVVAHQDVHADLLEIVSQNTL